MQTDGYQIQYSLNKAFDGTKTVTLKDNATVKKAIDKKKYPLFFSFEKKLTQDDMAEADVMIAQVQSALAEAGMDSISLSAAWVDGGDLGYILSIYISDYSESGDTQKSTVSQEIGSKITEKVNRAFGTNLEYYGGEGSDGPTSNLTEESGEVVYD